MSIELTCRCGWTKSFDQTQVGITIECPQCDRAFPITDDAAAFLNGNIGAAELSFADGVEVPEDDAPRAPRSPRPKPGSSHSGGASVSYRPTTGSRTLRNMRQTRRESQQRSKALPIIAIVVGVALVGYIAYRALQTSDRGASVEDALAKSNRAMAALDGDSFIAALGHFDHATLTDLNRDFGPIKTELGIMDFQKVAVEAPEKGSIDACTIVYHGKTRLRGYECRVELKRYGAQWKISGYKVRKLNAAEL